MFANILSATGVIVSALGFFYTVQQVRRTATAAEATRDAIQESTARMHLNYLMVLLPEFKLLEQELDTAAEEDDKKAARRVLVAYSHSANRAAALLAVSSIPAEKLLAKELQATSRGASSAKSSIVSGESESVLDAVRDLMDRFGEVSRSCEGLVATYQMKVQ